MKLGRNLDYSSGTAVEELGPAALDDLLERGTLDDWAPLAAALKAEPHGPLADTVLRVIAANPKYGTSQLWRNWIGRLRKQSKQAAPGSKRQTGIGLDAIRRAQGLTQKEVAARLGISQSDVSKLERRADVRLSTLNSYLKATGGRLKITVVHDGSQTEIPFPP